MVIWQVWEAGDMAETDSFHATKAEALKQVREYGAKGPGTAHPEYDWLVWEVPGDQEAGERALTVYLRPHKIIKLTRETVARALTNWPNR